MSGIITEVRDKAGRVMIKKRKHQSDRNFLRMLHAVARADARKRSPGETLIKERHVEYSIIIGDDSVAVAADGAKVRRIMEFLAADKKKRNMNAGELEAI